MRSSGMGAEDCREQDAATREQTRCEGAHDRGRCRNISSPRCVSMRTRSGADKSLHPRRRLPPGLDIPGAGCRWELGVEEVCEERKVRSAPCAGLLHHRRPLRAGEQAWRDAWAYMDLGGHVRALSSSPRWAGTCSSDDGADVGASCGPRACDRDTYSWLPRTVFTYAEGIIQRRGTFAGRPAAARFLGLRHHAGGDLSPPSALWRREAGCSRRHRAQLATCLGRGLIPRRWEDDRKEEAKRRNRHEAGGMHRARRIHKDKGGPRRRSRRRFQGGRRKRQAGSRWRDGHLFLDSLCVRVHAFDAEPEDKEQSWCCGCCALFKLCVNTHFDSISNGGKGANAGGRGWRSGTHSGDRLCVSVNPTSGIGGKGVVCWRFRAVYKVSPGNARRPRGGWRRWTRGASEMEGTQVQGTPLSHSFTVGRYQCTQGGGHHYTHARAAGSNMEHHRSTCHIGFCTSRYGHLHDRGGPICARMELVTKDWDDGADGDGGTITTQHHSPSTSSWAPLRQAEGAGTQRGSAEASRAERIAAVPARRLEDVTTGAFDDADADGSRDGDKGGDSDVRNGMNEDAVNIDGSRHVSGWSVLDGGPREGEGERGRGRGRGRGSKGSDGTRTSCPVEPAAGAREHRRRRLGRGGAGRREFHCAGRRLDGDLHAPRVRRDLCPRLHDDDAHRWWTSTRRRSDTPKRDPPRRGRQPPMRIGEAANPGPWDQPQQREGRMQIDFAAPSKEGFWGAKCAGGVDEAGTDARRGDDTDRYQLIVDTCNGTAWGTVARFLTRTKADLVLVQEHHLPAHQVAAASAWAIRRGWSTVWAPAEEGEGGGWRAGVCICARSPVSLALPHQGGAIVCAARVVAALFEAPGYRPTVAYSVYLKDGEGLSQRNLSTLAAMGQHIARQGADAPFIAGGDMQMSPQTIAAAGLADKVHAVIVATGCRRGTCRTASGNSELDYFMVEQGLARGIHSVRTVEATCIRTHVPVRLTLHPRLTSAKALVVRKPPPLPTERVYGPLRAAPNWDGVRAWAADLLSRARDDRTDYDAVMAEFGELYQEWSDTAEAEIEEITGVQSKKRGLRGRHPVLVWRSVVPERPPRPEGEDPDGLRWLAMLVMGMRHEGKALPRGDSGDDSILDDPDEAAEDECAEVDDAIGEREEILRGERLESADRLMNIAIELDDPPEAVARLVANNGDAANMVTEVSRAARDALRIVSELVGGRAVTCIEVEAWDRKVAELEMELSRMASEAECDRRRKEKLEWEEWVRANIDAGARNAHKFLKLPIEWQPTTTLTIDGIITSDPLKVLDGYARKYKKLWEGDDDDDEFVRDQGGWGRRCHLPQPRPEELREASRSFKQRTLVAYDGFHPRHYALLCDGALEAVGAMMTVAETMGAMPPQLRLLVMPLIPKPRTGHRAVAAFISFYRLWTKVRKPYIARWQGINDRPYLAAGKDRAPHDVVWRQAARAEAMVEGKKGAAGSLLWDLSTFFERLNRRKLRRRLVALNFPVPIARLAMAAYAGPRMLSMSGAVTLPIYSWRGVAAGCGVAVAFIQAYCIQPFDHMVMDFDRLFGRTLDFDGYYDDLVLSATGTELEVEYALTEGQVILADVIERELDCDIEVDKAAVVASSRELAARLIRRIGKRAGPSRRSAVNLGIDFAPGRRRSAQDRCGKRATRLRGLARKLAPFRKICRVVGAKASKIFVAGPLPFAVFGATVNGMTDAEVQKVRRAMATAWSPRARGRSLRMVTLLNRAPTHTAENGAAIHYCREVWRASLLGAAGPQRGELSLGELAELWHAVSIGDHIDIASGRRKWGTSRGPMANALLTLHRIGWQMSDPYTLVNDFGEQICITTHSPSLLAQMMHEATLRVLERQVGELLYKDGCAEFEGRRACFDQVRARLQSDRHMTAKDKAVYKSVLCNALMTANRAAGMGYIVDDVCDKCGMRGDTVHHRVWKCQHEEVVAARNRVAPRWLQEEACRRGQSDALYTKGLFPNPSDVWPRPCAEARLHLYVSADGYQLRDGDHDADAYEALAKKVEEWRPDDDELSADFIASAVHDAEEGAKFNGKARIQLGGRVYVDGSGTQMVFRELRRAAAGLVVRKPYGAVEARYLLPVWSPLPQTSQAAEFVAALAPLGQIACDTTIVSDCQGVVDSFGRSATSALEGSRRYAGLMKHRWATEARDRIEVIKTKAHRAVGALEPGIDREDAIGNAAADRSAKVAVQLHPRPTPAMEQQLASDSRRAALVMRTIAATLSTFRPMPRERMVRHPANREGAQVGGAGGHEWTFLHGLWRCVHCLRSADGEKLSARLLHGKCEGLRERHSVEGAAGKGHDVVVTGGEIPIIFCARCGAFSWRRAYGMARKCPRAPTAAGRQALVRLRSGLVPWISHGEAHMPRRRIDTMAGGVWSSGEGRVVPFGGDEHVHRERRQGARRNRRRDDGASGHDGGRQQQQQQQEAVTAIDGPGAVDIGGGHAGGSGHVAQGDDDLGQAVDVMYGGDDFDMMDAVEDLDIFGHGGGLDGESIVTATFREAEGNGAKRRRVCEQSGPADGAGAGAFQEDARGAEVDASASDEGHRGEGHARSGGGNPPQGASRADQERVGARGTQCSAVAACEGPGGGHPASFTVAELRPEAGFVAVAVAAGDQVVLPHLRSNAHDDGWSECGKTTSPPDGCVAPSEDSALVTVGPQGRVGDDPVEMSLSASGTGPLVWQDCNTPQEEPQESGAGPRHEGQVQRDEDGVPAKQVKVRRRDGSVSAAARSSVARGNDVATSARAQQQQPQRGWDRHKRNARGDGCEGSGAEAGGAGSSGARDGEHVAGLCDARASAEEEASQRGKRQRRDVDIGGRVVHGPQEHVQDAALFRGGDNVPCHEHRGPRGIPGWEDRGSGRDDGVDVPHSARADDVHVLGHRGLGRGCGRGDQGGDTRREARGVEQFGRLGGCHDDQGFRGDRGVRCLEDEHRADHRGREEIDRGHHHSRDGSRTVDGARGQPQRQCGDPARSSGGDARDSSDEPISSISISHPRLTSVASDSWVGPGRDPDLRAATSSSSACSRRGASGTWPKTSAGPASHGAAAIALRGGAAGGDAIAGQQDKASAWDDQPVPIWLRTPSWLYLPHLAPPAMAMHVNDVGVRQDEVGAGEDMHDAPIRGRGTSPGTRRPTPQERAHEKLASRNAHLARSLRDHAERVEKRKARERSPVAAATAAERIAAVRRRIAVRQAAAGLVTAPLDAAAATGEGRQGHRRARSTDSQPPAKEDGTPETGEGAATLPAAGSTLTGGALRGNEPLQQIHLLHGSSRIQDAPACEVSGQENARYLRRDASASRERDCGAGEGRPVASADAEHEASRVAWHDVGLLRLRLS